MKREKQILEIQKVKNSTAKLFLVHRPFLWMKELIIKNRLRKLFLMDQYLKSIRNSTPFPMFETKQKLIFNLSGCPLSSMNTKYILLIICTQNVSQDSIHSLKSSLKSFKIVNRKMILKSEGLTSAFSVRRRSSRARLSLYDIHTRQDQIPTPDAHIGISF